MDTVGIVTITTGALIGIPALVLMVTNVMDVLNKASRPPVATAYAVSAAVAGCGLAALTVLVVVAPSTVSMPYFVAAYPGFLVALVVHGLMPIRITRLMLAIAAGILYWNIDVTLRKPLIASATPLVVHHAIVALCIRELT